MRIDELVSMDTHGDFRSDVQLSDYEDAELNRELLRNYIFTVHAPAAFSAAQRSLSAKGVLEQLRSSLSFRGENRIALIANYGHGKSHLALVLANYFARPAGSEEMTIVLSRLEQALNNPAELAMYRDFKQNKGEFLVVRLQGDVASDLQEGFMRALEKALSEHTATRDLEIPFWYHYAEAWLRNLQGEALGKAEAYLATQNTDLPSLLSGLRRQGAYDLVRGVFHSVSGAYPDFGHEVSLEDLVVWAVDEVCVPNNLGGLLVLFDEFSLFLQKYMAAHTVGKLQELLNGISKRQGKSAFLAFSQQDMDTVVDTYGHGQHLEDVRKELERLPKDKRARLYSLMEGVLASYLKQHDAVWESWSVQLPVKSALARARESLLQHFDRRYTDLMWNPAAVEQKVVIGCFPLHPLTTAILSEHSFELGGGGAPRTALEFVRRTWEGLRTQPAQLQDGKPNFISATALVDFFGEQISRKWYAAYGNAIETSTIPLDEEHRAVLKALLLEQAVTALDRLKLRQSGQLELLSQLSGLDAAKVKDIIRRLSDARVIQYDAVNKVSALMPPGVYAPEMEKIIKRAVDRTRVDRAMLQEIADALPPLDIPLGFGHASDWSPRQVAFTASMLTAEELGDLLQPYRAGAAGLEAGERGLVVWLIARNEEERLQMRQTAQGVLDSVLGNAPHPLPGVVVLPRQAIPALLESARRLRAIGDMTSTEREKIGPVMYQQELGTAKVAFAHALDGWVGDRARCQEISRDIHEFALPAAYRAPVQTLKNVSVRSVVMECYRQAYAYRVQFYTQYAISSKGPNQLRTAVQSVARWLFSDRGKQTIPSLGKKDIQYQLATLYLTQQWGLLATSTNSIQWPTLRALHEAWDMLERTFPAGCQEVNARSALLALLNPPYGHDYNTLTLLLAAWLGNHQHEVHLSLSGQRVPLSKLEELFDGSRRPQDFLNSLCTSGPLAISRNRPNEVLEQVNRVLEQIRQGKPFSQSQVQAAVVTMEGAQANPHIPDGIREGIAESLSTLQEALQSAHDYDERASDWILRLDAANFDSLLGMRNIAETLPTPTIVLPASPGPDELQRRWEAAIRSALAVFCNQNASLEDVADYRDKESRLKRSHKALEGYPMLARVVEEALASLSQRLAELQRQEGEKAIVAEIRGMATSAALLDLYNYRQRLTGLTDLSQQTAALRDDKRDQIDNRIHQYEQFAEMLPSAVEQISQPSQLRQQRDTLLRQLDQVKDTPVYSVLLAAQQRISQLEAFYEEVSALDSRPLNTPADLADTEGKIQDIEARYNGLFSVAQQGLLYSKGDALEAVRQRKVQEARAWLQSLAQSYKRGDDLGALLRQLDETPAFLPDEDFARLEAIRQAIQRKRSENVLLRIEDLFRSIDNLETRRQCLKRLHELMEE